MKILITSGGTTEAIDSVRAITNHSTGKLGKEIATTFLKNGHQVTLVTTKNAVKPTKHQNLTIHIVSDVASLKRKLEKLVPIHDVCIHSIAVSDYTPVYMTDISELKNTSNPETLLTKQNTESKISSQSEYQVLFLKKTPKIIQLIKKWNPSIILFGFKLLVDVSKDELIHVARVNLRKNHADYILANDLNHISKDKHKAYLVNQTEVYEANSKNEIAMLIYEKVTKDE
ncbi:phosphopantothenate--cysteine ligase [Streptococcus urinalis]|nr:phosphopantothenate--cysteine ligase [Streptococcus urinalis]